MLELSERAAQAAQAFRSSHMRGICTLALLKFSRKLRVSCTAGHKVVLVPWGPTRVTQNKFSRSSLLHNSLPLLWRHVFEVQGLPVRVFVVNEVWFLPGATYGLPVRGSCTVRNICCRSAVRVPCIQSRQRSNAFLPSLVSAFHASRGTLKLVRTFLLARDSAAK